MFNHGRLEQVGTPREIYDHPATSFVASFVGTSNLLDDAVSQRLLGESGVHTVRPEQIRFVSSPEAAGDGDVVAAGTVSDVQYLGADSRVHVLLDHGAGASRSPFRVAAPTSSPAVRRSRSCGPAWRRSPYCPIRSTSRNVPTALTGTTTNPSITGANGDLVVLTSTTFDPEPTYPESGDPEPNVADHE